MNVGYRSLFVFLPEAIFVGLVIFQHRLAETALLQVADNLFSFCPICLASSQFSLSASLLIVFLLVHLIRFSILRATGNPVLTSYRPSAKETAISLLIVVAYGIFLIKAIGQNSTPDELVIGAFDILGASFAALTMFVIVFAMTTFFLKEK